MKMNRKLLTVLAALIILGAAAGCNKKNDASQAKTSGKPAEKEAYDYSKILKGDFSDFADAVWINGKGEETEIPKPEADTRLGGFKLNEDGSYEWSVAYDGGGFSMYLYPVGVKIKEYITDTTKVRLFPKRLKNFDSELGIYEYSTPSEDTVYYLKTSGKAALDKKSNTAAPAQAAVYYATSNLRLRSEPDTSKDNRIAGVPQGSRVELLETGSYLDKIDNINAPWFKVKTEDGTVGWLFSGYLTETNPNKSYDYSKILKGDLSDFAGAVANGYGVKELRADGTTADGQTASGFTRQNNPKMASDGDFYMWGVNAEGGGFAVVLFPIGVDVMGADGIIRTDKTRVRLTMGQDLPSEHADVFYLGNNYDWLP